MAVTDKDSRKPVIVLIGGIPGVGKSSISGYLARNLGVDIVLSGDYLREFLRPLTSGENSEILGVSVYEAWRIFGNENEETITQGFISQGKVLNKGLNAVFSRALKNGESLIVETLHFIPSQLDRKVLDRIIPMYIYISDRKVNSQRLLEREQYTHFNSPGQRLSDQLDRYRVMMKYSMQECEKFGIRSFDNLLYGDTREQILQYVKSSI